MTPPPSRESRERSAPRPDALIAFANRLARNAKHRHRWARRHGYGAYRVYDRDLPEFPFAIDCYVAEDPAVGMLMASRDPAKIGSWILALTLAMAATTVVLTLADQLQRWLGERAVIAFERLMGLVLTAVAVQMLLNGVREFAGQLK